MAPPSYQMAAIAVFCVVCARLFLWIFETSRIRRRMPPSPPGLPLLGNVLQLSNLQFLLFTRWKDELGSLFSLNLAGQPVVVINDLKIATDLLDRRSNIYSDRPRLIMSGEVMSRGAIITISRYGILWRNMRRATHEAFSNRAAQSYRPLQQIEASILVSNLLRDPENWDEHFRCSAASTVLSIVYGWNPKLFSENRGIVQRINEIGVRLLKASAPGAHPVEIFPSLLRLPDWLAPWKSKGRESFYDSSAFFETLIREVEDKMRSPSHHSFSAFMLQNDTGLTREEIAWLAGTLFTAGTETAAASLAYFLLAMVLYPDVMRRAQVEIDNVIGRDRLPTFSDADDLPYVNAVVKEVLRWRPIAPLSIPRRCTQDDWYEGYLIPEGTLILENLWAINHDPKYFVDSDEFCPERFLDGNSQLAEPLADTHGDGHRSYGSGRRICVGKDLADQELFIDIAAILWALTISKYCDEDGNPITPPKADFHEDGLLLRPAPFRCAITHRDHNVLRLLGMENVESASPD